MSEQTYRNPLFGQRVDRYIPPELRQGLGAVLALGDMLNPVSAYREYIRDVGEEDYPSAAANLAGFVAPGAAGAIASRLGRSGIRAIEPYSDDAARALMEMLSPTGAPEVSRGAEGMSRREFLAGLGAAAATPALPVDEIVEGLGRVGARGGGRAVDELLGLVGRRNKLFNEWEDAMFPENVYYMIRGQEAARPTASELRLFMYSPEYSSVGRAANARYGSAMKEVDQEFFDRISSSDITQKELESLSDGALRSLAEVASEGPINPREPNKRLKDAASSELAERIYSILDSRGVD